jgi:hypothetical protein
MLLIAYFTNQDDLAINHTRSWTNEYSQFGILGFRVIVSIYMEVNFWNFLELLVDDKILNDETFRKGSLMNLHGF